MASNAPVGHSNSEQAGIQAAIETREAFSFENLDDGLVHGLQNISKHYEAFVTGSGQTLFSFRVFTAARVERKTRGLIKDISFFSKEKK